MSGDESFLRINNNDQDDTTLPPVNTQNVHYRKATFASMLSFSFFAACLLESKSDAPYLLGDNIMLGLLAGSSFVVFLSAALTWNAANHSTKALSHSRINETKYAFGVAALGLFAAVAYACVQGNAHGWKEFVGFSGIYSVVGAFGALAAHSSHKLFQDNKPKV